jgi:hypothetical protein
MMWKEGVGWLGAGPTCEGTNAGNQCLTAGPVTIEHGCRQIAAARGEKSERQNVEGPKLELLLRIHVDCETEQHRLASWTCGESTL